jgi:hypothetical protein
MSFVVLMYLGEARELLYKRFAEFETECLDTGGGGDGG